MNSVTLNNYFNLIQCENAISSEAIPTFGLFLLLGNVSLLKMRVFTQLRFALDVCRATTK